MKYAHRNIVTLKWQQIREWEAERYVASFIVKKKKKENQNSYLFQINNCASFIPASSICPCVSDTELSVTCDKWCRLLFGREEHEESQKWHRIKLGLQMIGDNYLQCAHKMKLQKYDFFFKRIVQIVSVIVRHLEHAIVAKMEWNIDNVEYMRLTILN